MLPELNFKTRRQIDAALYFKNRLSLFLNVNKDTEESISRINIEVLRDLRDVEDQISAQKSIFGLIFSIALCIKDYDTIGYANRIYRSLSRQLGLLKTLDNTLLRTKIDKQWAKAIHTFTIDKTVERCERLNKTILPELIQVSRLSIYADYLEKTEGITLIDDIRKWMTKHNIDEGDINDKYRDHIMETIESHEKTLSEDEKQKLLQGYYNHKIAKERRIELAAEDKHAYKEKRKEEFYKDAYIVLQNWATDNMEIERRSNSERIRIVYKNALNHLYTLDVPDNVTKLTFKCIAIAKYNNRNQITPSSFKWLSRCGDRWRLISTMYSATAFFDTIEPAAYEEALDYCNENGFVVATVDLDIDYTKHNEFVYDYDNDPCDAIIELYETVKDKSYSSLPDEIAIGKVALKFHKTIIALRCFDILVRAYDTYGNRPSNFINKRTKGYVKDRYDTLAICEKKLEDKSICSQRGEIPRISMSVSSIGTYLNNEIQNYVPYVIEAAKKNGYSTWQDFVRNTVNISNCTDEDMQMIAEKCGFIV